MTVPVTPLVVMVLGLAAYGLGEGKLAEVGRVMFFAGLLAFLLGATGHALRF